MGEVVERTELVDVVLEGGDDARRAVLQQELDQVQGLQDLSPALPLLQLVPDELVDLLPFLVVVGRVGDLVQDVCGRLPILL